MEDTESSNFKLSHYKNCLLEAVEREYKFITLSESKNKTKSKKLIINRHDVDTQVDISLKMAKIENSLNISSTYFFRFHSHGYNLLNIKNSKIVREISEMGHEIGLHFEPDFYNLMNSSFSSAIEKELFLLSQISGKKVTAAAPHEPSRTNLWKIDENIAQNIGITSQAYEDKIMKDFKYISDSSCRWREGSMFYHITNETYNRLYILTHPYWWFENSPIENY